ncbi:MAG: DUF411 domain-containing protein [Gammaproteobacteria bacterium]|nr:DUF411 domain-containing protein [Gammaproteobacteria bacterium]MDH3411384.1 DUF411 domain-containing protein [Gammaproteobacteria bacterium]
MPGNLKDLTKTLFIAAGLYLPLVAAADPAAVTVYKTASCGCCQGWVEHMRNNGFDVTTRDLEWSELSSVRSHYRIPESVHSCHTAVVDGYVVEGHVPAEIVNRLLTERPAVIGISAPGMPAASPGMDVPGGGPYDIVIFDAGGTRLYQRVE